MFNMERYRPSYANKEGLPVFLTQSVARRDSRCQSCQRAERACLCSMAKLPLSEVSKRKDHLIDSHIMERIFDSVVEFGGRFEVEHFSIGRTNSEPSSLRLRVEAPSRSRWSR